MPNSKLPPEGSKEWEEEVKWYVQATREEVAERATALGYADVSYYDRVFRRRGVKVDTPFADIPKRIEVDVEESSSKREAKYYKKLYQEAVTQIGLQTVVAKAIKDIAVFIPPIHVVTNEPLQVSKGRGSETAVLQLSDLHAGEVVEGEATLGLAQYDFGLMNRRLDLLFRKVLDLVTLRRSALNINSLIIAQQGDMVSGDIHDELVRTNVENMMTLCVRTAYVVSQGIAYLAPHFNKIEVVCVVGNHPRLYSKPYFKEKYVNWDYMMYQWEAVFCRDLKNVKFIIPKSPFYLTNAEKTRLLIMHGDSIKSWMGIPWYGIERTVYRLRDMLQGKGERFDSVLLAHFHNRAELDKVTGPIVINGSVKGGDEFSIGSLQTVNQPSQNLLYYHDKHGYLGGGPIYLKDADHNPKLGFKDFLPDIWSSLRLGERE